uniref:alpha-esterase 48 isoform 5bl n=1 Tax=Bombyx mori TaxID=7091 RepID=UPI0037E13150
MISAVNEFLDDLRGGRMSESPLVTVEQGQLQGRIVNSPSGKAFYSFQGIPYAKPPLGSLRFKAPQPPEPWDGIRDATAEGNVCAQIDPVFAKSYVGDENCLFLNVYTPSTDGAFLPVMIWIHGGGFKWGSGNTNLYGPDFLVDRDVVVVTINYRCGALGFLSLNTPEVPGNAGIKDIVQAIRWVKDNIHHFGGNAGNLTIFGESAGARAVSLLTASPLTKNLISKAIIQSGNALSSRAFQRDPLQSAKALARSLGCEAEDVDEILEFLIATPAKDLVEADEKLNSLQKVLETSNNLFGLVIEKEFPGVEAVISEPFINILTSGRTANIPILVGTTSLEYACERKTDDLQELIPADLNIDRNSEEALAIVEEIKKLYFKGNHTGVESLPEYFHLLSDKLINLDTHRYIKYLLQVTNRPIYYYRFDYVGELNIAQKIFFSLGLKYAMHMDELGYLFKNDFQKDVEPTPEDIKMRERIVRLWTNFAKSGNPIPDENHYLNTNWLPVTNDNLYCLNLNSELTLISNPDQEKMDFWEKIYDKHYRIWDETTNQSKNEPQIDTFKKEPEIDTYQNESEIDTCKKETEIDTYKNEPEIDAPKHEPEIVSVIETVVITQVMNKETSVSEERTEVVSDSDQIDRAEVETQITTTTLLENNDGSQTLIVTEKTETPEQAPSVKEMILEFSEPAQLESNEHKPVNDHINTNGVDKKARTSNEIKMVHNSNGAPKDVIRANDPPEDDLPKNIGVNKFVSFFESLGGKK